MSQNSIAQNELIVKVLTLGRQQSTGHTVAQAGDFTAQETEALRRLLRSEYQGNNPAVVGSWRQGYELAIGGERIGVTNGHGPSFRIYYRRCISQQTIDLLAEIEADVKAKMAGRNAAYDLALSPDPLNLVAQRSGWMVAE